MCACVPRTKLLSGICFYFLVFGTRMSDPYVYVVFGPRIMNQLLPSLEGRSSLNGSMELGLKKPYMIWICWTWTVWKLASGPEPGQPGFRKHKQHGKQGTWIAAHNSLAKPRDP